MPIARSPSTCWTRLGDHPGGVGEVDQPGAGRPLARPLGEVDHRRDRPQREADAAGAGRLLPEHAVPERDALVDRAALEPADADGAEHEVGALERVVEVGGGAERHSSPCSAAALEHAADALEPARVDVVQHDLVERERAAREQRPVDQRDAEPSAPDDRELHGERP